MDLLKLSSTTSDPTVFNEGQPVVGYERALWVERYQKPGEFEIEARLSSGLLDVLTLDSFITHVGTSEVMMVENIGIKQNTDEDPMVTFSGRSFPAWMENRFLLDYHPVGGVHDIPSYVLTAADTWTQIVQVIDDHLISSSVADDNLVGVDVREVCSGTGTSVERNIRIDDIYTIVFELLKIDDLGIRTVRPTTSDPLSYFEIYQGDDKTKEVRFSWIGGDLDEVEYFFSNKKYKNRYKVMGRWVQVVAGPTSANYDRRTMFLDASDLDQQLSAMPTAGALFLVSSAMDVRGIAALAKQKRVSITQVDVSPDAQWTYRVDYQLGDLVSVDGDFGSSTTMRVVEFAEIEDENGSSGHPTLAIPGED